MSNPTTSKVPTHPSISVLIRTFNSEKTLGEVLSRLDFGEHDECVVVDSGSTDSTLTIAKKFDATIIELDPPFNYSRSLNEGFKAATSDLVMVLSSHCIPLRKDLMARMREVAIASSPGTSVIYGKIVLHDPGNIPSNTIVGDFSDWKTRQFSPGGNGFAMYPKDTWEKRQFDESLITSEDLDWMIHALRAGGKAVMVSDALVLYRNQGSVVHMFRKGWNETVLARGFHWETIGKPSARAALGSFVTNSLHLTKSLAMGNLGIREYLRMCSHGLGASLASAANPKAIDPVNPGNNQ